MNKQVMNYRFKMKDAMTAKEHCDCGEGSEVVIEIDEYEDLLAEFEKKVRQVEIVHMVEYSNGVDHVDTVCKLGDSYDKGFEHATRDKEKVTCKNCHKRISK